MYFCSVQVVFSQTSDLAEQPPMAGSVPSSSKESMTSENVDQTFISRQFDFLNDEVRKDNEENNMQLIFNVGFNP
jgi:hypothetical protein